MKVLICFASKGKTKEEIESLRTSTSRKASRALRGDSDGIEICDPFLLPTAPIEGQKDSIEFVSDLVHMLIEVDAVYLAKGWSSDRYCKVVFNICQQYGIKYMSE